MQIPTKHFSTPDKARLRLLTLNAAHGRKDAANQLLLRKAKVRANLRDISTLLSQTQADIVALQEADGVSRWSGGFDHTNSIADEAGYPWQTRSSHTRSWLYNYGTAVLSRHPIVDTLAHRFAPSPPTLRKGFVIGQIAWQPTDIAKQPLLVDVLSLHLDFLSKRTRQRQIQELSAKLARRHHPLIVLGDFNDEWSDQDSSVRTLAEQANLSAYLPDGGHLFTYQKRRLDWILISPELEFHSYEVLPDMVSDHRAVIAEIGFRQPLA